MTTSRSEASVARNNHAASAPFGSEPWHLSIDLSMADPASSVTRVLQACCPEASEEECWNLPVSARIARMISALRRLAGVQCFHLLVRCRSCGASNELALRLEDLEVLASGANETTFSWGADVRTSVRRPTGQDQRAWRQRQARNKALDFASMAADLCESPPALWSDSLLNAVGEALEELDPLTAFRVEFACTDCRDSQLAAVDLQALCLARFRDAQRDLYRVVHRMARAYGWTEREVLSLPTDRRRQYLSLIEEAG